jgi:very-long-chain (3R)-3-hydroxyacyl-CoA dehydratase
MITAWCLAEIIRYSQYILSYLEKPSKIITWLRYSGFIVLYPMGVFSELSVLYAAYPKISQCCPRVLSFEMPNEWNFSFDYLYFIWIVVIPSYVVGFPFLYNYMVAQRKRKLTKVD